MINGLDVTKEPLETKRRIAYIPEQVTLYFAQKNQARASES